MGLLMTLCSCGHETPVSSGILQDDEIKVSLSDEFLLKAEAVLNEAPITYTALNNPVSEHYAGQVTDPIFGSVSSSFYFQMGYFTSATPAYEDVMVDSAILMLSYDRSKFYGDYLGIFDVQIFILREDISLLDSLRANVRFDVDVAPIGRIESFKPGSNDTLSVFNPVTNRTDRLFNVLRIPLNAEFYQDLITDSGATGSNANLFQRFSGFYLTAQTNDNSMVAFNFSP